MDPLYLIIAYSLVWVFLFAYLLGLAKRLRSLGDRLSAVERSLHITDPPHNDPPSKTLQG